MTSLSIANWTVNSVRLRADMIARYAAERTPDILCLQEIKCREAEFPASVFAKLGYHHLAVSGQKGMHGVATLSKRPLEVLETPDFCRHGEARTLRVRIEGLDIDNLYVPAGGDDPDPDANPKFDHKLDFVARMAAGYAARRSKTNRPLIVVGDLNIAPGEHDVWSHKQLLKVVSHTPVEVDGLNKVIAAGGFTDLARVWKPDPEKLFTWWSYRSADWTKNNRGRRLDHIWVDDTDAVQLNDFAIDIAWRSEPKPSDHAPVLAELNVT